MGGEVILAAPAGEGFVSLSGTAAAVWDLLVETSTLGQLVRDLSDIYDAPPRVIAGDVETLLRDLCAGGWVEEVRDGR